MKSHDQPPGYQPPGCRTASYQGDFTWFLFSVLLLLLAAGCALTPGADPLPLNPETLHLAWSADTGGQPRQSPVTVKDIVVLMPEDGKILAWEAETGEQRWDLSTPARLWPNSFNATLEDVIIAGENGRLLAMTTRSGLGEWEIGLAGEVLWPPLVDRYIVFAATSVHESKEGQIAELVAINAATGEILWKFTTDNTTLITPARGGDLVYVGGVRGDTTRLYALTAAEGQLRWKYEASQGALAAIYANDEAVALLGEQGHLTALDSRSGSLLWQQTFAADSAWLTGWEELLIFEDGATLRAWNLLGGEHVWEYQAPQKGVSRPLLLGSDLHLLTQTGQIITLEARSGLENWRYSTDSHSPAGMAISQGWLFIAGQDGVLYAYTSE